MIIGKSAAEMEEARDYCYCRHTNMHRRPFYRTAVFELARHGKLELLQWLEDDHHDLCNNSLVFDGAARGGQLHVLKWAFHIVASYSGPIFPHDRPCLSWLAYEAASEGHLHVVQWLTKQGKVRGNSICKGAARGGHINIIHWAVCHGYLYGPNCRMCFEASRNGHLKVLKRIVRNGGWNAIDAVVGAAIGGHFPVLRWLEGMTTTKIAFHQQVIDWAAPNGHLEIVKWSLANGAKLESNDLCREATIGGHLEILMLGVNSGLPWNPELCAKIAVTKGYLDIMKWILSTGKCSVESDWWSIAIEEKHWGLVKWVIIDQGLEVAPDDAALLIGHRSFTNWADVNGYGEVMMKWVWKHCTWKIKPESDDIFNEKYVSPNQPNRRLPPRGL